MNLNTVLLYVSVVVIVVSVPILVWAYIRQFRMEGQDMISLLHEITGEIFLRRSTVWDCDTEEETHLFLKKKREQLIRRIALFKRLGLIPRTRLPSS